MKTVLISLALLVSFANAQVFAPDALPHPEEVMTQVANHLDSELTDCSPYVDGNPIVVEQGYSPSACLLYSTMGSHQTFNLTVGLTLENIGFQPLKPWEQFDNGNYYRTYTMEKDGYVIAYMLSEIVVPDPNLEGYDAALAMLSFAGVWEPDFSRRYTHEFDEPTDSTEGVL